MLLVSFALKMALSHLKRKGFNMSILSSNEEQIRRAESMDKAVWGVDLSIESNIIAIKNFSIYLASKASEKIDSKTKVCNLLESGWDEKLVYIIQNALLAIKSADKMDISIYAGNAAMMMSYYDSDFNEISEELKNLLEKSK